MDTIDTQTQSADQINAKIQALIEQMDAAQQRREAISRMWESDASLAERAVALLEAEMSYQIVTQALAQRVRGLFETGCRLMLSEENAHG